MAPKENSLEEALAELLSLPFASLPHFAKRLECKMAEAATATTGLPEERGSVAI